MILNQIWGPQLMLPQLVSVTPFGTAHDYRNYLHRLAAFPLYLEQVISLLRLGIQLGWVQPSGPLRGVADQIQGQLVPNVEESALYAPFRRMPEAIPEAECEAIEVCCPRIHRGRYISRDGETAGLSHRDVFARR